MLKWIGGVFCRIEKARVVVGYVHADEVHDSSSVFPYCLFKCYPAVAALFDYVEGATSEEVEDVEFEPCDPWFAVQRVTESEVLNLVPYGFVCCVRACAEDTFHSNFLGGPLSAVSCRYF